MNKIDPNGLNPAIYEALSDFASGFLVPGPPPPTPAGAAGWWVRDRFDAFVDIDKVANHLKDAWIDYLDDDMVYRQFKYQNEMKNNNTPESQYRPGEYYWVPVPKDKYYWESAPCE